MAEILRQQFFDTTRGRIVTQLRTGGLTAEDLAAQLGLTQSAVRAHMSCLERDGVVRRAGKRAGTTRPSHIFELTPDIEQLLSKAYIPVLTHLVGVFARGLSAQQLEGLLRRTGKELAGTLSQGRRIPGRLKARVQLASELMNEELGGLTEVQSNGRLVIRGAGCPLAALTGKHPGLCLAMESFVASIAGVRAKECCSREGRPSCCFELDVSASRGA